MELLDADNRKLVFSAVVYTVSFFDLDAETAVSTVLDEEQLNCKISMGTIKTVFIYFIALSKHFLIKEN
jgi:hypothetical protein